MDIETVKSILVAAGLGFMTGMQRSIYHINREQKSFAGSRTFSIIALVGYMSGILNKEIGGTAIIAGVSIGLLILLAYYFKVSKSPCISSEMDIGSTTHFTALATFLLGLMVSLGLQKYAIFLGILIIVLLEIKPRLQKVEAKITSKDINAAVLLLAMTFLILPILPNRMIGPYHLFNPYKTWLMAVIISTLSFVGYAAIKIFGHKRGLLLTGALGGMVSSTAVSVSMSKIASSNRNVTLHVASAISIACTFMFFRVLILAFLINPELALGMLIPFLLATITGLAFTYFIYQHSRPMEVSLDESFAKNPLQLSEAVRFAIIFGIVYGASEFVQARYGNLGVYIISLLSGLTDVDAITLSLAQLARDGKLLALVSINGIIIASVTNSFVKLGIATWIGGKSLGFTLLKYFLITLTALSLGLIAIQ